jgi:signal transduction histidine kinase
MSHLALVSTDLPLRHTPALQAANQLAVQKLAAQNLAAQNLAAQNLAAQDLVAHDLRNLLATVGLHVETLQRLSGPSGVKAADAAHALLTRGAALCNTALDRAANADFRARRRGVDLAQIAHQVIDLLSPTAPKGFCFKVGHEAAGCALADADEVFRILFNLMSNAVAVANRKANLLETVTIKISTEGTSVTTRVTDDGPGLPACVRVGLFRIKSHRSTPSRHGYGLAIARELAERNGGTLTLAPSTKGASFALKLPALLSVLPQDRFLGRRAMSL